MSITQSQHGDECRVFHSVPPGPEAHLGLGPGEELLTDACVEHHHLERDNMTRSRRAISPNHSLIGRYLIAYFLQKLPWTVCHCTHSVHPSLPALN